MSTSLELKTYIVYRDTQREFLQAVEAGEPYRYVQTDEAAKLVAKWNGKPTDFWILKAHSRDHAEVLIEAGLRQKQQAIEREKRQQEIREIRHAERVAAKVVAEIGETPAVALEPEQPDPSSEFLKALFGDDNQIGDMQAAMKSPQAEPQSAVFTPAHPADRESSAARVQIRSALSLIKAQP